MSSVYCIVFACIVASATIGRGFNIPAFVRRAHVASVGQNRLYFHQAKVPPAAVLPMSTNDEQITQLEATYAVGQEYLGVVSRAKGNGIVVNVTADQSVFLPRSRITRGTYERLKSLLHEKSEEAVRVEIIAISKNGTLSAKYLPPSGTVLQDAKVLSSDEWRGRQLNGTVVAAHDYGLFVELDEFGIEGQVPSAGIPKEMIGGSIRKTFAIGSALPVYVDSYDPVVKKLVLSMAPTAGSRGRAQTEAQPPQKAKRGRPKGSKAADTARAALTEQQLQELARTAPQRWIQAVVQNVTPFGLFVRPANYDVTGLVRVSRIPKELLALLKQQVDSDGIKSGESAAPPPTSTEPSTQAGAGDDAVALTAEPPEGVPEGVPEGILEGILEGAPDRIPEGIPEGVPEEIPEGIPEGVREGDKDAQAATQRAWSSSKKTKSKAASSAPGSPHHVDLTTVLSAGDVVRVRVFSLDPEKQQLELTMLQYRPGEREAQESGRPESSGRDARPGVKGGGFDPEDTLIWWRGDAYLKTEERLKRDMTREQRLALLTKEAQDVIYESSEVVDGTWRRAFEEDLALDEHDSTSRGRRKLLDEIDAQIGALAGFDGSKIIDMGIHKVSDPLTKVKFGVFMDPNMIPPEWRDQVDFFRVAEEREKMIDASLRAGKKGDRLAVLDTIRELQRRTAESQAQSKGKGAGGGGGRVGSGRSRAGTDKAALEGEARPEGEDTFGAAVRRWQPRTSQAIPGIDIATATEGEEGQTVPETAVPPNDDEPVAESIGSEGAVSSRSANSPDGVLQ